MRAVGRGDDANRAFSGAKQALSQTAGSVQNFISDSPGLKTQTQLLSKIGENANSKVQNITKSTFKKEDNLPGGTIGAIKNEARTGQPTGGVFHATNKAPNTLGAIQNLFNANNAGKVSLKPIEVGILKGIQTGLQRAVDLFKNYKNNER